MDASIKQLQVSPAQMRTRVRVDQLAALAVQVRHGLDPALPLLVTGNDVDGFRTISGHRRWLAAMIAALAKVPDSVSADKALEFMHDMIHEVCPVEDGYVILTPGLYEHLVGMVSIISDLTLPVETWQGNDAEQVMLLIKANLGAEEPDLLGQAQAFHAAVEADVTLEELAQVSGLTVGEVNAIMSLPIFPKPIQDLINDERLGLRMVFALENLDTAQLNVLAEVLNQHVQSEEAHLSYTAHVELAVSELKFRPEVPDPKNVEPDDYNRAVFLQRAWDLALEKDAATLYRHILIRAMHGLQSAHHVQHILAEHPATKTAFVHSAYGHIDRINQEVAFALMPEFDCEACVFSKLIYGRPPENYPSFPCVRDGLDYGPCWCWTPEGRPFRLATPWQWTGPRKTCTSFKAYQKAWRAQQEFEKAERDKAKMPDDAGTTTEVEKDRLRIQHFMDTHTRPEFDTEHPWATTCARCRLHLDESPLKGDPDAPHCAWAKGKRLLVFYARVPEDGDGPMIPMCRQFAPSDNWTDILPETGTAPFPRELMVEMIKSLASSTNRNVWRSEVLAVLEFLTGRPLNVSDPHRDTFFDEFSVQENSLSDGQVWTLFQWVLCDWSRTRLRGASLTYPLPPTCGKYKNVPYESALIEAAEAKIEASEDGDE